MFDTDTYSFKNKVQNIKKNLKLHQVVVDRCTVNLNFCCWNILTELKSPPGAVCS